MIWPIIYCAFSVFLVVVPLYASPVETGMGCLIIATGIPVYLIFVKWENKPKAFLSFMSQYFMETILFISSNSIIFADSFNIGIQKIMMVVPEEKKVL